MVNTHTVRVAVIGAGNMGRNHIRNYSMLPNAELVGIADINPITRKLASEYRIPYFNDYRAMLAKAQPAAVSIVVPTTLHADIATTVLQSKIHCLVEKPVSSTVDEADKLIALAKKQNIIFTVGHIEHYNPIVRKLKQLIDSKKLGEITSVICKRVGGFPTIEPRTDVIIDLAVHDIGIISFLLNQEPVRLYSHGSRTHHSKKIDSAELLIDYGRASGFIQANWLTPVKIRTIAITGSKGYVEGNYITQELVYYKHNMRKSRSNDGFSNFVITMGEPEKSVMKVKFEEPLGVELKRFLAHIQGKTSQYLVHPFTAREALRLALEAIKPYDELAVAQ